MKLFSRALLAAGLVALSACGGGAEEDTAANTAADDLYNVTTEDLTLDNGLGNDLGLENEADLNVSDSTNLVDTNTVGSTQ